MGDIGLGAHRVSCPLGTNPCPRLVIFSKTCLGTGKRTWRQKSGHELSSGLRQILSLPRMPFCRFLWDTKGGTGQLPIPVSPISSCLKEKHSALCTQKSYTAAPSHLHRKLNLLPSTGRNTCWGRASSDKLRPIEIHSVTNSDFLLFVKTKIKIKILS